MTIFLILTKMCLKSEDFNRSYICSLQILEKKVGQQAQELEHLREDNTRLQSVYEETQHSAIDKDTLLQRVTAERDQLRGDTSVSTFLAGAGVLLIGWLLGWTRLRLRRKVRRRQGLSL